MSDELLMIEHEEVLKKRIMTLNEQVWENRSQGPKIEQWLKNFTGQVADIPTERVHALYWLSQFMYFGGREIRILLQSMYRDLYLCPMIQELCDELGKDISDADLLLEVNKELKQTCFVGVGNPSESGVHLLYYFRQENGLGKKHFRDATQIFTRSSEKSKRTVCDKLRFWEVDNQLKLRNPDIKRYIFLDDICGSGDTAIDYSKQILHELLKLNPSAKVAYYSLFATSNGLENVRNRTLFQKNCAAVYELDSSFRCLSDESRYLKAAPEFIDPQIARNLAIKYGEVLHPDFATGWKDSQMLMGFHHNTPDNTIGIMWMNDETGAQCQWHPIFKRYPKIYGGPN